MARRKTNKVPFASSVRFMVNAEYHPGSNDLDLDDLFETTVKMVNCPQCGSDPCFCMGDRTNARNY